jgi:hypothetical protein
MWHDCDPMDFLGDLAVEMSGDRSQPQTPS